MALVADFHSDIQVAAVGETVNFTDDSTGGAISRLRDFGDGLPGSVVQNATRDFATPGLYTIQLTVGDGVGFDDEIKVDYIDVGLAPVADFSGDVTTWSTPLDVQFTDASTNSPTSRDRDFGDGTPHWVTQSPLHTYAVAWLYTVVLVATNAYWTDTDTKIDYIEVIDPVPVAAFSGTPVAWAEPLSVQFTDASTNSPTSWDWDFGDGSAHDTTQNPLHIYHADGLYTVTLIATNAFWSDTLIETDYILVSQTTIMTYPKGWAMVITTTDLGAITIPRATDNTYKNPVDITNLDSLISLTMVVTDATGVDHTNVPVTVNGVVNGNMVWQSGNTWAYVPGAPLVLSIGTHTITATFISTSGWTTTLTLQLLTCADAEILVCRTLGQDKWMKIRYTDAAKAYRDALYGRLNDDRVVYMLIDATQRAYLEAELLVNTPSIDLITMP